MSSLIIFVAGQGGHFSQFERLFELIKKRCGDTDHLLVTDKLISKNSSFDGVIMEVGELRPKSGFSIPCMFSHFFRCLSLVGCCRGYGRVLLISHGPGIAILAALIIKLRGGKVLHIETWSRFYSRSLTGRIMYFLSDVFYVQNVELLRLYKNAIYSGRL